MKRDDEQFIQSLLDGEVSAQEFDQFQERLRSDAELKKNYLSYVQLYHALDEFGEELKINNLTPVDQLEPVVETTQNVIQHPAAALASAKKRRFPAIPASIAAVLAISGIAAWFMGQPNDQEIPPALATFGPQAEWTFSDHENNALAGSELPARGTLTLTRGTTQLKLAKGVTAWIQAPAKLTYLDPMHVEMSQGRAHFHVAEEGHGFTLRAGELEVVDLGTRFGLSVMEGQPQEVHVLEGTVAATASGIEKTLAAGEAVQLQPDGLFQPLPANEALFPSRLAREILVFKDDFRHRAGPVANQRPGSGNGPWVVTEGKPRFDGTSMVGGIGEMAIFGQLNAPRLGPENPVLLVTVETKSSASFHSPGFAGVSLFRGNEEAIFFGDCHGDHPSWGLDIRRHGTPIHPPTEVRGARSVTLRYDFNTGEVSLFHGLKAQGKPFLVTKCRPNLDLDRIRIAHGKGGELNVNQLVIRTLTEK